MNSPMLGFPRPSGFEPICRESGLTTTIVPALLLLAMFSLGMVPAFANVYGAIRGIVHDPQHRPVQGAMVMLKAKSSDWAKSVNTDASGEFQLNGVPLGDYTVSVASPGFQQT